MKPRKPGKPAPSGPQSLKPQSDMDKNTAPDNSPPGLDAEIQAKIGQKLRAIYDDVVQQGVPDRFVELLRKLDDKSDKGQSE